MTKLNAAILSALTTFTLAGCSPSFSKEDIDAIKKSITQEFGKREGIKVVDVVMLKESATKLTGYAKISVAEFGEITKPCSATMAQEGGYIWRCE